MTLPDALAVVLLAVLAAASDAAPIVERDAAGRTVRLDRPAARVVSLAPGLTELVFAAGGGASLIAVDTASDYPPAALSLPRIGDASRLDIERIVASKPDLVLVWQSGNTGREVEQLESLGIRTFRVEPRRLGDVPRAIEQIGRLLGRSGEAAATAAALRQRLAGLRARHAGAAPVRVFYQVWSSPLLTISGGHMVNDAIELCGGRNVFAALKALVPHVSIEAVIAADPEAFFTASERGGGRGFAREPAAPGFAVWQRHRNLAATRGGFFYALDGDAISRQGPRIADGVAAVCAALDEVRGASASRR